MIKCGGECSGVTGWPARSVDGSDVMTARAEGHAISCLQITPLLITSTGCTAGEDPRNSIYRDFLKLYVEFRSTVEEEPRHLLFNNFNALLWSKKSSNTNSLYSSVRTHKYKLRSD